MEPCLICEMPGASPPQGIGSRHCPRCGTYVVLPGRDGEYQGGLGSYLTLIDGVGPERPRRAIAHRRARLSHMVRRQQGTAIVGVPLGRLDDWKLDAPLPNPIEQLNNLILWIGSHQPSYAERAIVNLHEIAAWIGCQIRPDRSDEPGFSWLMDQAPTNLFKYQGHGNDLMFLLTMTGWSQYEELKSDPAALRTAFMAMKFNDPVLDRAFAECFQPACARAGYVLRRLSDEQGAGLIDDQLRVALRTARFVIADLTHGNQGAYWEAGFAEGLGRPVIYTCRQEQWTTERTHFDTNHLVTVDWTEADFPRAQDRIVATIRSTLPAEARMTDAAT